MDANQGSTVHGTQKLEYEPTKYFGSFGRDFLSKKSAPEVLEIFWGTPLEDVRKSCVEWFAFHNNAYISDETISWLEERIPLILDSERGTRFSCWKQLLAGCLFSHVDRADSNRKIRVLEFAVSLFLKENKKASFAPMDHELSKIIAGAVHKHPELYWAPLVPEFLEASLENKNWNITERALELICIAKDTSFLPRVIELSKKAGEAAEKKEDFKTIDSEGRFASAKALGVLREAVRHLVLCKVEEQHDVENWQVSIAQAMRELGGFEHLPRVIFSCPKTVPSEMDFSVELSVMRDAEDAARFSAFLERCRPSIKVEGAVVKSESAKPYLGVYWFDSFQNGAVQFKISGFRRKGIRLSFILDFYVGKFYDGTKFAKLTRYISRAD